MLKNTISREKVIKKPLQYFKHREKKKKRILGKAHDKKEKEKKENKYKSEGSALKWCYHIMDLVLTTYCTYVGMKI